MTEAEPEPSAAAAEPAEPAAPVWRRRRVVKHAVAIVLVFLAAQTLAVLGVGIAAGLADPDFDLMEWAETADSNGWVLTISTFLSAALCTPLVVWLAGRGAPGGRTLLGLKAPPLRDTALWCAALLALIAASDGLTILLGRPVVPPFMTEALASSGSPALLLLALVVGAPLFEELFFRGHLLGALREAGSTPAGALIATSASWAILHLQYDVYGLVTIFAMGLLMGAARWRTGSVVPCLAMHALANAVAWTEAMLLAE